MNYHGVDGEERRIFWNWQDPVAEWRDPVRVGGKQSEPCSFWPRWVKVWWGGEQCRH